MTFDSPGEVLALIVPIAFAMTGGLLLQLWLGHNVSVAVWVPRPLRRSGLGSGAGFDAARRPAAPRGAQAIVTVA
jgi:hypothetical protein